MPELAKKCIESWHKYMPDWEYKLWNEDNFDVNSVQYTKEAYEAKKYAFVSDYVRLKALYEEGGVYLDTDVKMFKSLSPLLNQQAFAGFEGSKYLPVGTCVMGSKPDGKWIAEQYKSYSNRHFIKKDGSFDIKTNVIDMTQRMSNNGLLLNGLQQNYLDCTIYPTEYFSPFSTSWVYTKTENTYCDHLLTNSWDGKKGLFTNIVNLIGRDNMLRLIKVFRMVHVLK